MILIAWYILQSWISGYRDVARFFYKGTWDIKMKAKWLPYWDASQDSKLDPFHAAGGLMWASIITLLSFEAIWFYWMGYLLILKPLFIIGGTEWYWLLLTLALHGAMFWLGFYWQRNCFMHIWAMGKGYKQWKYLNPVWKLFERKK